MSKVRKLILASFLLAASVFLSPRAQATGNRAGNSGYAETVESRPIYLKNKINMRISLTAILLDFWACGVLG